MRNSQLMIVVQEKFRSLAVGVRKTLRQHAQFDHDARYWQRCRIILNLVRGRRPCDIQLHLGCSCSSISRVVRAFIGDGPDGLLDGRVANGLRKINEAEEEFLLDCAAKSPATFGYERPTWTLEVFALVLKKVKRVVVSISTLSRTLGNLRVRPKRPRPFVQCPWKRRRKTRRLNELQKLIDTSPEGEVTLYVDEVDIHLNPKIGYDWMPCGLQKSVLTPGKNKKHYLAGALDAHTGEVTFVESDYKDSQLFIDQLWTLVERDYPDAKHIHLILDNYCIHSSGVTQLAVNALADRMTLHFLPPYCPNHNRIERVWKDLHAEVTRNHTCSSMDELMANVRRYIANRNCRLELAS